MKTHINTLYFSETLKRIGQAETSLSKRVNHTEYYCEIYVQPNIKMA